MKDGTYKGGLPYAIDRKRLDTTFPITELVEGRTISHERLEDILGIPRGTHRYYSVINSWIRGLKNSNGLILCWQPTIGLKVLDPAQTFERAETRTRQKIRQTGRAIKDFAWVDRARLDEAGQQRYDHQIRVVEAIKEHLNNAKKQLAVELGPVKSLPKPKIEAIKKVS